MELINVDFKSAIDGKIIDNKPPGVDSTGLQYKEEILEIIRSCS